jgi:hypothetical protein
MTAEQAVTAAFIAAMWLVFGVVAAWVREAIRIARWRR